jgi:hypothetical protein
VLLYLFPVLNQHPQDHIFINEDTEPSLKVKVEKNNDTDFYRHGIEKLISRYKWLKSTWILREKKFIASVVRRCCYIIVQIFPLIISEHVS